MSISLTICEAEAKIKKKESKGKERKNLTEQHGIKTCDFEG